MDTVTVVFSDDTDGWFVDMLDVKRVTLVIRKSNGDDEEIVLKDE